ncbi:MAG: glycosyltransferase family 1 protein [Mycobacterium sp.]|nr:glycosyltransferase family 1 protein [Mycobacterium sp.]
MRAIIADGIIDLVVHVPADAEVPDWLHVPGVEVRQSRTTGVIFEQVYLPFATVGGPLLNFAGPAPLLKRNQIVTMHDATPFRFPQTFRRAFVLFYLVSYYLLGRWARRLVTVSRFSASELDDVLGIHTDKFVVAGCAANALTAVEPQQPELPLDETFYLTVGTLAVHKNLPVPVQAVAESGRTIVVVGASGNQQVFSQASTLSSKAIVAGRLSDAELAWLYRNARGLIFPSKYEGFGIPPLEAQSLGCPVVTSNAASLPEVAGDAALYFDPDDMPALLSQLDRLETEEGLADSLRQRGLANAQRYSWEISARRILNSIGLGTPDAAQPSSL